MIFLENESIKKASEVVKAKKSPEAFHVFSGALYRVQMKFILLFTCIWLNSCSFLIEIQYDLYQNNFVHL